MRTIPSGLATHILSETKTLAWCWKVQRTDGQIFRFTSHDKNLVLNDGGKYMAESGFVGSAAQAKTGLSVDDMQIDGAISSTAITKQDVLAGLWDGAEVTVYVTNWASTGGGNATIQKGRIGNIELRGGAFVAEIRSIADAFNRRVGRTVARRCDADFGDARCGVNLLSHTVSGEVTVVSDNATFSGDAWPSQALGKITWDTGANSGRSMEIKTVDVAGNFTLALPMFSAIQVGDTYTATAGCGKNRSDCKNYSNINRFRGFPDIPGMTAVLEYPDAG